MTFKDGCPPPGVKSEELLSVGAVASMCGNAASVQAKLTLTPISWCGGQVTVM